MRLRTVRQVKQQQQYQKRRNSRKMEIISTFQRNLLNDDEPATKSLVQLSALEAESIVEYFIATMYGGGGGQEAFTASMMNGNMIEASLIPGSTGISPSPTIMQQQHADLYNNNNNNGNMLSTVTSLRTHSSKFPIERELILSTDKGGSKVPIKQQYTRQIPTTPVAFNRSSIANGNGSAAGVIQQFLPKSSTAVAPDHPTTKHAWNPQSGNQEKGLMTGAIPRAPTRMPEDVTALAEREMGGKDGRESKNAVTKTYHTLKDLISSKFKKDSLEMSPEELNNVTIHQQAQNYQNEEHHQHLGGNNGSNNTPYYNLMQQHIQAHQQHQWNSSVNHQSSAHQQWNGNRQIIRDSPIIQQQQQQMDLNGQQQQQPYTSHMTTSSAAVPTTTTRVSIHQHRAASQPQLNLPLREHQPEDRRGSLANIDVTDSDEGGFATKQQQQMWRQANQRPMVETPAQQILHQQQQNYIKRSSMAQSQQQLLSNGHYQPQFHLHPPNTPNQNGIPDGVYTTQKVEINRQEAAAAQHEQWNGMQRDNVRSSFGQEQPALSQKGEKQIPPIPPAKPNQQKKAPNYEHPPKPEIIKKQSSMETSTPTPEQKVSGSAASSDYDKSGNHSSNVDSGRGSAAYSSGRKALDTSPDHSDTPTPQSRPKSNDSEWIDIVDAELRHILEPGIQNMNLRPESTISGSLSSISPPLPPISPDADSVQHTNDTNKHTTSSNTITNKGNASKQSAPQMVKKPEYGTDSYNRPGKNKLIGPSRGIAGSLLQKRAGGGGGGGEQMRSSITKKQEQSLMKRHLFGLDDLTSTTTRSLDLDSLLGGPWGAGQSVSDSETDTQGLRHIKSQLEGLETMYSEVLKMLGARGANHLRHARRRQGSLSSLPSSSVSGRPIRDRRRNDERRKVRDIKGINKRFQRLESHVVTLARSVAHLSSEMRSQHLVMQELDQIRQEMNYRGQQSQFHKSGDNGNDTADGPNLSDPRRVKKLTKFFGEDPPLMRLFLKKLGYEKYATLFEKERVGMIELPYLGEERLQKLGVPLGPRLRILQEAQISLIKDKTLCIV